MIKTMNSQTAPLVRNVLVQDSNGLMQVVVPQQALLDLSRLEQKTGRKLLAIPLDKLAAVTHRKKLQQLEAAPSLFELPTLIDESLSNVQALSMEILDADGGTTELLALDELKQILGNSALRCQFADIAIDSSALDFQVAEPATDSRQIGDSIKSFSALRIQQRLQDTLEIPPLPAAAEQIVRLRQDPNASVRDLIRIVESDPSLAAQVVSWASSPYFAAGRHIQSVSDAIVRVLGFDLVSNMALGLVVGRTLALPKDGISGMTPFWQQAVYCATAMETLHRLLPARHRPQQGLAYLSGLLHNFGYLVLAQAFPPHFMRICRYAEANPAISHVAIEHHLIGVSREQISAWLMQCWELPEEIAVALRFQHNPDYEGDHAIYAHLVFIALRVLRSHGIGDAPPEPVPAELYRRYGLGGNEVEEALALIANSRDVRQIADHLNA